MQKLTLFQNSRMEFSLREARCIWQELPLILPTNDAATPGNRADNARKQEMIDKAHADLAANNEPQLILPPSNETPSDRAGGKMKIVADALRGNPDVRNAVEQQVFKLKAKQAVKTAFKNACNNRTFARENGNRKYDIAVNSGTNATLMYNVNGRTFVTGDFEVGEAGARLSQAELTAKIEKTIVDDIAFAEVIAPQIKTDND